MWCWRRLLRVPWTTRRSNQSILKEISSEYSLEGLMLKLKLQYFGHLMQRTAAAAAKSLQSCPTLCDPINSSPPGSSVPGILQARTLEWVAIAFSDAKNGLLGKDADAGKGWRQEEKGAIEDEMVGWHHGVFRHEFEQALGISEGQASLACCSPRGRKSRIWLSDWTDWN